ncbi:MAG: metallophosphoesterase [Bryobacteraceae bacterium]|nr:metallophosphoesterase [Bryobacteraceae bacterium]
MNAVRPLVESLWRERPHITVLSGDFVQNGTREEFAEAREFLRQLPEPWIAVPGNHDLPFRNVWNRFRVGLRWYREFIADDIEPFWTDGEIAVLGTNTARPLPLRGGRINEGQVREIEARLASLPEGVTRILVSHHPFDLDPSFPGRELVGRARMAMGRLAQSIDVLLAGHMHLSQAGYTAVRYRLQGRSAIFVQAGTATSDRGRGEPNAYNRLYIGHREIRVERWRWNPGDQHFQCATAETFDRRPEPPPVFPPEPPASELEVQVSLPEVSGSPPAAEPDKG